MRPKSTFFFPPAGTQHAEPSVHFTFLTLQRFNPSYYCSPMFRFRLAIAISLSFAFASIGNSAPAHNDANRLTYLDEPDPFYVARDFPKLTTPQWIGEPGVEAAVILAIDD